MMREGGFLSRNELAWSIIHAVLLDDEQAHWPD
jgi:hypothetical protein